MKIVLLEGSPHKNGASNTLARAFAKGAQKNGHTVTELDIAHMRINPCMGCASGWGEQPCVLKDDMEGVRKEILQSDMLVFVTPIYFYGLSGQMKILIDRFHCFSSQLKAKRVKSALIASAWRTDSEVMHYIEDYYLGLSRYLGFRDSGMILGYGCGTAELARTSRYEQEAFRLGKSL